MHEKTGSLNFLLEFLQELEIITIKGIGYRFVTG